MQLSADEVLTLLERVQGAANVEAWLDAATMTRPTLQHEALQRLATAQEEDEQLRERVQSARELLPDVQLSNAQLLYLCETATRADCEGQRAEVFATMVAK